MMGGKYDDTLAVIMYGLGNNVLITHVKNESSSGESEYINWPPAPPPLGLAGECESWE